MHVREHQCKPEFALLAPRLNDEISRDFLDTVALLKYPD
jgi:hypothetical protein